MLDTGLAARIAAKGVTVVELAGWQLRTRPPTYEPEGAVNHHTAGSRNGTTPSLATVLYGRSDVPGPLAQVLQSREADPSKDKAYVVAAGTANHAGRGGWRGLSGNSSVGGLEVEHPGIGRVPVARLEISARIIAALLEAPGSTRSPAYACQHFEWTSRKIDFHDLAPWNADSFRQRVGYWIGRTISSPPSPRPKEGFLMGLSDAKQDEAYKMIKELHLGRPHKTYGRDYIKAEVEPVLAEIKELVRQDRLGRDEKEITRPHLYKIEERIDGLDAKLDQLLAGLAGDAGS